jgi:hypothetical protein
MPEKSPRPLNQKLYEKVKAEIYGKMPIHSAYRSGLVVKEYKRRGGKYAGSKNSGSLNRWFKEDWRNQRGEIGYSQKGDVYRPTKRVSSKTPSTFSELSSKEISRAKSEKARTGRVKSFKKNPFKSKSQWRKCFAMSTPGWDCEEFKKESPPYGHLPEYVNNPSFKEVMVEAAVLYSDGTFETVELAFDHFPGASIFDETQMIFEKEISPDNTDAIGISVLSVQW